VEVPITNRSRTRAWNIIDNIYTKNLIIESFETVKRAVILASGNGSLAQAIIDDAQLGGQIVAVVSDRADALVLERARSSDIPTHVIEMKSDRKVWDKEILDCVNNLKPDLVISAGFMRILSPDFVQTFPTINSHPALLPLFPGAHAVRDALVAGASETGTTIHWVDQGMDTGKIIMQARVSILPGDNEASLHERIKEVERGLIVAAIKEVLPTLESRHG
jgi:phosphoribosylglycinamide formyltransferase-1